MFYAVISAVEKEESENKSREHETTGDKRLKRGLVHVKRLGFALPWLIKMLELDSVNLVRDEDYEDAEPTIGVITDASPKGVGAVLVKVKKGELTMYEAFETEFTETGKVARRGLGRSRIAERGGGLCHLQSSEKMGGNAQEEGVAHQK